MTSTWKKSTYSNANGNCAEVDLTGETHVGLRDSKQNGTGPELAYTRTQWLAFLIQVISGTCEEAHFSEKGVHLDGTTLAGEPASLWFTRAEWDAFIDGVRDHQFDLELAGQTA